jgi:catechol 2,3-dioxygenase-like lactoylglutathione lyase family enzyme
LCKAGELGVAKAARLARIRTMRAVCGSQAEETRMTRPAISHSITFTYTDDLSRASAFFREVMELDFVVDQGTCHIFRLTPLSYIGVCNLPDRPQGPAGVTLTIVAPDVDAWRGFLEAKGVVYVSGPDHSEEFGVYSSLFHSPDGYRIEIQSFDDPDWDKGNIG